MSTFVTITLSFVPAFFREICVVFKQLKRFMSLSVWHLVVCSSVSRLHFELILPCLVTDAGSQPLMLSTAPSNKLSHQLQTTKVESAGQRVTKTGEVELGRQKSDLHITLDNSSSTIESALNDLALLSTRNQSTSSGISSATSTNKFNRKVPNWFSCAVDFFHVFFGKL